MCTINISTVMQGRTFPDAGSALFDMINPALDAGDRITLDMNGVDVLPSMFLNPSIGRIVKERGMSAMSRFTFRNISRSQMKRLRSYVYKIYTPAK